MNRRKEDPTLQGYRARLAGATYVFVGTLELSKTNRRAARCTDCSAQLQPGQGIYRSLYGCAGYVCLDCARRSLQIGAPLGYAENCLGVLHTCHYSQGPYTAEQVAASIQAAA